MAMAGVLLIHIKGQQGGADFVEDVHMDRESLDKLPDFNAIRPQLAEMGYTFATDDEYNFVSRDGGQTILNEVSLGDTIPALGGGTDNSGSVVEVDFLMLPLVLNIHHDDATLTGQQFYRGVQKVGHVRETFERVQNTKVPALSLRGVRLNDNALLKDVQGLQMHDTLAGELNVLVVDTPCGLEPKIKVHDFWTVEVLKNKFATVTRRVLHPMSQLRLNGRELYAENTLCRAGVFGEDGTAFLPLPTLEFVAPPYRIIVAQKNKNYSGSPNEEEFMTRVELEVEDKLTVQQVKEMYTQHDDVRDALLGGDRLMYNGIELQEQKQLYMYRLKEGSMLLVNKEDTTQLHVDYTCADCNANVRLKRDDVVICRECGHRIVFKKRTRVVGEFLAR